MSAFVAPKQGPESVEACQGTVDSGQWTAHLLLCPVQLCLAENEYVISLVSPSDKLF